MTTYKKKLESKKHLVGMHSIATRFGLRSLKKQEWILRVDPNTRGAS